MPTVAETADEANNQLAAGLELGTRTLAQEQEITFTAYVKLVLPLDGYVFWVKASLLTASALFNALRFNGPQFNQSPRVASLAQTITVKGSLHYATDNRQNEESTQAVNAVIFTCFQEVNDLNEVGSTLMYIGEFNGQRFAFNRRAGFYKQANLFHYRGDAVYPSMQTQLVDSLDGFDTTNVVVSNSLPLWLALNRYMPVYPSYLVDQNVVPPYAAIHIPPGSTEALQQAPRYDRNFSQWQLVQETVKITIWGFRNFNALDYVKYLMDDSLANPTVWGLMNTPIVQDEKITQSELNVIAQRKVVTFEVNYYQQRIRDIVRQLILSAFITFIPSGA